MSTSAVQTEISPSWKDEVNRRVAAHKNRKAYPASVPAQAQSQAQRPNASAAASAAARVAARYASAPSYSEMLQEDARAAVRAAEEASRAARVAQAKAEQMLAGLEMTLQAASTAAPAVDLNWEIAAAEPSAAELPRQSVATAEQADVQPLSEGWDEAIFGVRWEDDLPVRGTAPPMTRTSWQPEDASADDIAVVEGAQPILGNVIEFPRELVAARKARPRLIEGPYGAYETDAQLSIFEVHPDALSTEPQAAATGTEIPAWIGQESIGPEWSGISLDAEAPAEMAAQAGVADSAAAIAAASAEDAPGLPLAPVSRRLLAVVMDAALVGGAFMTAAAMAAMNATVLPPLREVELGSGAALLAFGALYMALFFTLARATPGMKYAGLSLCTIDGHAPGRTQRCGRLLAMVLSLLPVGLGMIWAIFDEEHLSWHDRLSGTYLRRG